MNQNDMPLLERLIQFSEKKPVSLHVPGHKNGTILPAKTKEKYQEMLSIDLTELPGLDDLHAPEGIIAEAQKLASQWFQSKETFFLIGGSTAGNLAMILATCQANDKIIVQRNCHKSIWNAVELSGATPILLTPAFDKDVGRYTVPSQSQLKQAINEYPEAKAIILTYPDYFGRTYELRSIIETAHKKQIAVLIDEAHGVHFSIDHAYFPESSLALGADAVVQSAHKMAPAMTMTAYLHINSSLIDKKRIATYLSMLQSSSPSYPLLASLDSARQYLATRTKKDIDELLESVMHMRDILSNHDLWELVPFHFTVDDPLKIALQVKDGVNVNEVARLFEEYRIYPELITENQILLIHGLAPFNQWKTLENAVEKTISQLKVSQKHATIERDNPPFLKQVAHLAFSYQEMERTDTVFIEWENAKGKVAAEQVVPYPPGIPILVKGEVIETEHVDYIKHLISKNINFQQDNIQVGLYVFKGECM